MKVAKLLKLFILFFTLSFSNQLIAQKPVNWTNDQLLQPSELAQTLEKNKKLPIIISVGPGALIPNSVDIGSVQEEENLNKLKSYLSKISKKESVVIYCGCCPFEHCPNVRPAIDALKELQFTNYKLLNLSNNLKTDWIDKGYPSVKL